MELTVLVDNNSKAGSCLISEHGLSFFIEDYDLKLLFDCGSTDAFIKNAYKMQIDMTTVTDIVLSHSHFDHIGGLLRLQVLYQKFKHIGIEFQAKNIIAHPDVFRPSDSNILDNDAYRLSKEEVDKFFNLMLTTTPMPITQSLMYLGQIPTPQVVSMDYSPDESALAYKSKDGLVIISGCSHCGIDNIIEHAKYVTGENRVNTVIGGLYLINKEPDEIKRLGEYLLSQNVQHIYPCHCTDLGAKIILSQYVRIEDVATGKKYTWE